MKTVECSAEVYSAFSQVASIPELNYIPHLNELM